MIAAVILIGLGIVVLAYAGLTYKTGADEDGVRNRRCQMTAPPRDGRRFLNNITI